MSGSPWPVAKFKKPPLILWSASNRVAHTISARFFGYHYAWCTPIFEAGALGRYAVGAGQPPSSDPASIYRTLHASVKGKDRHSDPVNRQRDSLTKAITNLLAAGAIDGDDASNAAGYLDEVHVTDWVPVIYAIPYTVVAGRVLAVPDTARASHESEFLVPDLVEGEFDIIEPWPC